MQKIKKLVAVLVLVAMTGSFTSQVNADEVYYDDGAYEDSRMASYTAPAIALGAVALIAVIAVACQKHGHHGHSSHSH